jgi:hypothetical protein
VSAKLILFPSPEHAAGAGWRLAALCEHAGARGAHSAAMRGQVSGLVSQQTYRADEARAHGELANLLRTSGITKLTSREAQALRQASMQSSEARSALRQTYLDAALRDKKGGATQTGVRWWLKFCMYGRTTSPLTHLDASSPWAAKLEAEQLLIDFVLWLALSRPSGRPVSAASIAKYVGQVRAWHLRTTRTHLCGDLDYSAIQEVLRGVERMIPQPEKLRRWGVRTQDLAAAIKAHLDGSSQQGSMWAAALATAFCGLMRGSEIGLQDGESFDPLMHLTRADVSFRTAQDGTVYMVLRMRPAKKGPGQRKDVPLLIAAGGSLLDPVRLMQCMLRQDPVDASVEASTPLFRLGRAAITVRQVRAMVQLLMQRLGLDSRRYGAHSLRIGGATAALAAGMSAAAIRAAGRWSSDVYRIYCRLSRQSAASVASTIGSTPFEDLERGVQFVDEELMLTVGEMPGQAVDSFVERDLIEDAWGDDEEEP